MTQREAFEAWALRNTSLSSAHEMAWAAWQQATARCIAIVEAAALESNPDDFALDLLNEAAERIMGMRGAL